jgi:hypothetical protein
MSDQQKDNVDQTPKIRVNQITRPAMLIPVGTRVFTVNGESHSICVYSVGTDYERPPTPL